MAGKAKKISIKSWFRRFGVQISMFYLAAGLMIVMVLSGAIYFFAANLMMDETVLKTRDQLEMSGANISTYIARIKGESNVFAADPMLRQYLSGKEDAPEPDLMGQIMTILSNDAYIKSLVVVSKDGRILSNEENLDMSVSEDMMKEGWYTDAIHNTMPVLTGARMQSFSADKDNWVISVSTEITDSSGENLGVLLMDMRYSVIEDHLRRLNLGKEGYVFLLNDKGEPVYHKDTSYFSDPEKKRQLLEILKAEDVYNKRQNQLTYRTNIENAGWTMVGVVSLDNLKMLEQQLFEALLLTGGLLFLAVLFIGILFTRRLAAPMADLERGMSEIEKLTEISVHRNSFYEVELLAGNYNRMIRRIRALMDEIKEKEETLRHSELNVLVSQINPHFLYNTLDTIRSMAIIRDSEDIAQMAESLSMLFRYSISRPGEMATLKDELDNVKNYLVIQGYRFPGKFKYQQRIEDEELLQYKLPVLTIQPVIENAIHHGLETKVGGGQVSVYAYSTQERFIIRIADNGMGMTEQQMDSLRERLSKGRFIYEQDRDLKKRGNTGIALPNVNQRIKFYYGDDYGIKVYSTAGIGTIVEIILPAAADSKGGES